MVTKGSKTEKNLLKTFAGESKARNKYTFYAEKARLEGYEYIASVFYATAENEKAHAREAFGRYLKKVQNTSANLEDAAEGEAAESEKLYKQFEEDARDEGFNDIADFYKELAEVEDHHMNRFMMIKENLDKGDAFKRDNEVMWQCMNCGYIHFGTEAPEICPLCKFPRAYFKIYCEDYK
jgi:rubrerythrin